MSETMMSERDEWPPTSSISTGIPEMDKLIGGPKYCDGIPRGRITELAGNSKNKSHVALRIAKACLDDGGTVCWIDPTASNSPKSLEGDSFIQLNPTGEYVIDVLLDVCTQDFDLIVVDSHRGQCKAYPHGEEEARFRQSEVFPEIIGPLRKTETALVFTNHLSRDANTSLYRTYGSRAMKYYSSLRIRLFDSNGSIEAQTVKNMVSPNTGQSTAFTVEG